MKRVSFFLCTSLLFTSLLVAVPMLAAAPTRGSSPADTSGLRSVKRVFIEKMDNDFDQDLRIQITRQFKGDVSVVLDREMADAIMIASTRSDKGGIGWGTLKYMGLDKNSNGVLTLMDKAGKIILWADEAGDRAPWVTGNLTDGARRTLAARLVHKMKNSMR